MTPKKVLIIGGGAAGFFCAIRCKQENPALDITIIERGKKVLQKVKVSGGGRCNVTHACWTPRELSKFYPRGEKAMLGPFTKFCTGDMVDWLERHGVETKIEEDNRMFPVSDDSQTIVDCFLNEARRLGISIVKQQRVSNIIPPSEEQTQFTIQIAQQEAPLFADAVMIAAGSSPQVWSMLENIGHSIVPPVPSLFTFNIEDSRLENLPGLSATMATVKVIGHKKLQASGPLLITHWGLSGPAVLRLSAWGARELNALNYKFKILVNFLGPKYDTESILEELRRYKEHYPKRNIFYKNEFGLPNRLWNELVSAAKIEDPCQWANLPKKQLNALARQLTQAEFEVDGKSTFKEEFVTAGGVKLKEINFKTFESKLHPGLYFAGEVLDIDAITGGFNFQAAWTGAWIAGGAIAEVQEEVPA